MQKRTFSEILAGFLRTGKVGFTERVSNGTLLLLRPIDSSLPPPGHATSTANVGKLVMAVLKGWLEKLFVSVKVALQTAGQRKLPAVYSFCLFCDWYTETFHNWKIGVPHLRRVLSHPAMRYGAEEVLTNSTKPFDYGARGK